MLPAVEAAGKLVPPDSSTHIDQVNLVEIVVEPGLGAASRVTAVRTRNSHGESRTDRLLHHSVERNPEVSAPQCDCRARSPAVYIAAFDLEASRPAVVGTSHGRIDFHSGVVFNRHIRTTRITRASRPVATAGPRIISHAFYSIRARIDHAVISRSPPAVGASKSVAKVPAKPLPPIRGGVRDLGIQAEVDPPAGVGADPVRQRLLALTSDPSGRPGYRP